MRRFPPEWSSRKEIDSLTRRLGLREEWCQDWALEVAEPARVREFCHVYETAELTLAEKFALMELIVFSFDDYLDETHAAQRDLLQEARVDRLLREDFVLHLRTIEYWSCLDEETWANPADPDDPENGFLVTPMMRRIWRDFIGGVL